MKTFINTFSAIIKSIFTFIGFGIIAVIFYNDLPPNLAIVVGVSILIIGAVISYKVFNYIMRRGILEVLSENESSSDMDQLEPTPGSGVKSLTVQEFVDNFKKNDQLIDSGKIRIWGDWNKRDLDKENKIKEVNFLKEENSLQIIFENNNQLSIWNPRIIHEATTYLKIIKATKIKWEWDEKSKFQVYKYKKGGIATFTNSDWNIHEFDTSMNKAALVLM